nr:gluconate 2-dehydrogenase subunit 3 family protein [Chthonobacter albigriseus]
MRSSELTLAAAITVTAGGALLNAPEAWAMDVKALKPETMKTLIQLARDIYPHDKIADRFYAIAVKGHDDKAAADGAHKELIEKGIADLDAAAGQGGYLGLGWEAERVKLLRGIEETPFFQAVRGDLVVSLYNQQEVWPIFGYEGESYSKGGYIERGFDDIDWL